MTVGVYRKGVFWLVTLLERGVYRNRFIGGDCEFLGMIFPAQASVDYDSIAPRLYLDLCVSISDVEDGNVARRSVGNEIQFIGYGIRAGEFYSGNRWQPTLFIYFVLPRLGKHQFFRSDFANSISLRNLCLRCSVSVAVKNALLYHF